MGLRDPARRQPGVLGNLFSGPALSDIKESAGPCASEGPFGRWGPGTLRASSEPSPHCFPTAQAGSAGSGAALGSSWVVLSPQVPGRPDSERLPFSGAGHGSGTQEVRATLPANRPIGPAHVYTHSHDALGPPWGPTHHISPRCAQWLSSQSPRNTWPFSLPGHPASLLATVPLEWEGAWAPSAALLHGGGKALQWPLSQVR